MSDRGFVAIPNHVVRDRSLPPTTRLLFGLILSYAWGNNPCKVPRSALCEEAGMGKTAFFAATKALEARGLIRIEKVRHPNGWTNRYWPLPNAVEVEGSSESEQVGSSPHGQPPVRQAVTEEDEQQKKTKGRENAQARARGLNGNDVRSLVEAVAQEAEQATDRKFYGLWVRGEGDRVASLLEAQVPAVRVALVEYLFDQIAVGWQGKSIAIGLSGRPLDHAKAKAAGAGRPLFGDRPLTAAQQRAAWSEQYRREAEQPEVIEGVVVE